MWSTQISTTLYFLLSEAYRLAQWVDAPMKWRALFERSELVRPPVACVYLI